MLAAIPSHTDDIPIYAGGTMLKLIDEGYGAFSSTCPTMRWLDAERRC